MKHEGIKELLHNEINRADEKLLKLIYLMVKGYANDMARLQPAAQGNQQQATIIVKREIV